MADDGEIKIKTSIDNSELDKGLKDAQKKVKDASKTIDKSTISTQKFGIALKNSASQSKGLSASLSSVAKAGGPYAAAIGAATKFIEAIRETSEAFKVQQKAELELEAAAKNNPYLSEKSVYRLKEFAGELQKVTNIGDETAIQVEAQLAATGRTEKEIIKIMKAAADYAAATGQDIASAAQTLNMTYSGMAGTLGRQIGAVKELTEEQLKNGDAIDIVAKSYEGMAKATLDARTQAQNAKGDFAEALGEITKPTADAWDNLWKGFYEKGSAAVKWISNALKEISTDWSFGGIYKANEEYIKNINDQVKGAKNKEFVTQYLTRLAEDQTEESLSGLIHHLEIQKKLNDTEKEFLSILKEEGRTRENYSKNIERQTELKIQLQEKINKLTQDEFEARLKFLSVEENRKNESDSYEYLKLLERQQEEEEKLAEARKREKTADDYAKENTKALNAKIKAMEIEAKIKGEEVSAQDKYNAYMQSYIDLLTKTEDKIKEGYPIEAQRKQQLEEAKKAAEEAADAEEKLTKAIEYTNQVTALMQKAQTAKTPAEKMQQQLSQIEEAKRAIEQMTDAEVKAAQKDTGTDYSKIELLQALEDAEKQITLDTVNEATAHEKSAIEQRKEANRELAALKEELAESTVLSEQEAAEAVKKINKEMAQNTKDNVADMMSQIKGYTDQTVEIMRQASDLMLQTVKYQTDAELATLEKKYLQGEISEEEYEEAKIDAKKKGAKEEYKIQMFQWSASIMQATANIAQGVTQAIAQGGIAGLITGALVAAAGGVQIASIIASKPTPPSFASGGIVQGNSYTGDKVRANVNSGEMILNATQQRSLWEVANGKQNGSNGTNVIINNSASNIVNAQPQIDKDKIVLTIDARVNDSLRNGRYDQSLTMANQGMGGDFYGI